MRVDIWTDIVCPFCYIGHAQFSKALEDFSHKDKVEVVHHSFQLQPDAPKSSSGRKSYEDLAERKGESIENMKEMFRSVAQSGDREGLVMNMLETTTVNTFDGHQLIHFAAKHGKQDEAVRAMFEAYFTDNRDVADRSVLREIAAKVGLDEKEFDKSLTAGEFADSVKADVQQAASIGIRGVPFFMIDDKFGISGARGAEAFASVLEKAWKESHPLHMIDEGEANVCADGACV